MTLKEYAQAKKEIISESDYKLEQIRQSYLETNKIASVGEHVLNRATGEVYKLSRVELSDYNNYNIDLYISYSGYRVLKSGNYSKKEERHISSYQLEVCPSPKFIKTDRFPIPIDNPETEVFFTDKVIIHQKATDAYFFIDDAKKHTVLYLLNQDKKQIFLVSNVYEQTEYLGYLIEFTSANPLTITVLEYADMLISQVEKELSIGKLEYYLTFDKAFTRFFSL